MTTIINSNGSKWAGQEPDTIETLLDVLAHHPLDNTFEPFFEDGRFFGNFRNLSHVFSIDTDDADVIAQLNSAIKSAARIPSVHLPI